MAFGLPSPRDALAGEYQQFFAGIDTLMLLAAPSFAVVREWRIEQKKVFVCGKARTLQV